jgi:hypothetical protein
MAVTGLQVRYAYFESKQAIPASVVTSSPTARRCAASLHVTFWSWAALPSIGPYAVRLLQSLGYRVSLRTLPVNPYFGVIGDSRNRAAAGTNEWISDYPAPGGFIAPLFTCSAFKPRSSLNLNSTEFCDPKLDRQIDDALRNEVTDP